MHTKIGTYGAIRYGKIFNSKNYYCKDTHCIDVDRKDDIDVIYKKVKRS